MATLKFDVATNARKITKEMERRIRIDFKSGDFTKNMGKEYKELVRQKVFDAVYVLIPAADQVFRSGYVDMLNNIAKTLLEGIPHGSQDAEGWDDLTDEYWKYKRRKKPGTEWLFWKFTPDSKKPYLSKAFRSFATTQATKAGFGKQGKDSYQVKIGSEQFKSIYLAKEGFVKNNQRMNNRFRITLGLTMPEIKASTFRDILFRQQFILHERELWGGTENTFVFKRMLANESLRPWLHDHVMWYGRRTQAAVMAKVEAQAR